MFYDLISQIGNSWRQGLWLVLKSFWTPPLSLPQPKLTSVLAQTPASFCIRSLDSLQYFLQMFTSHPPSPLYHPQSWTTLYCSIIGKNCHWLFVMICLLVWEFDFLPVRSHLAPHCVSALGTVVINRCLENMVERGHSGTMSYTWGCKESLQVA